MDEWRDIDETIPVNGRPFTVLTTMTFRFEPYASASAAAKNIHSETVNGVLGRWQYLNESHHWVNIHRPIGKWKP